MSKGDLSDAVRKNRKAVREQIKQAVETEPPAEMMQGKNGDTAPIYEEVDVDRLMQEADESVPEFPLDTLPDRFRQLVDEGIQTRGRMDVHLGDGAAEKMGQ